MGPSISIRSRTFTNAARSRLVEELAEVKRLKDSYALIHPIGSVVFCRSGWKRRRDDAWSEFVAVRELFDVSVALPV